MMPVINQPTGVLIKRLSRMARIIRREIQNTGEDKVPIAPERLAAAVNLMDAAASRLADLDV